MTTKQHGEPSSASCANDYSRHFRVAYKYEGKVLVNAGSGNNTEQALGDFDELFTGRLSGGVCYVYFIYHIHTEDARVYAYLRFETGDEMSRRAKFALVTWIGSSVTALKKAAVSTDKAFVKEIFVVSRHFICKVSIFTLITFVCIFVRKYSNYLITCAIYCVGSVIVTNYCHIWWEVILLPHNSEPTAAKKPRC